MRIDKTIEDESHPKEVYFTDDNKYYILVMTEPARIGEIVAEEVYNCVLHEDYTLKYMDVYSGGFEIDNFPDEEVKKWCMKYLNIQNL